MKGRRRVVLCIVCRARWAQTSGYCRGCGKAAGITYVTASGAVRAVGRRAEQDVQALQRVLPPVEREQRTIVVEGVEYVVAWDGT